MTYQGTYSKQSAFTLKQDSSYYVIQHTPVSRAAGRLNLKVQINANDNKGSFETTLNTLGQQVFDGFCDDDMGGVTCFLAQGNEIKKLNIVIDKVKD